MKNKWQILILPFLFYTVLFFFMMGAQPNYSFDDDLTVTLVAINLLSFFYVVAHVIYFAIWELPGKRSSLKISLMAAIGEGLLYGVLGYIMGLFFSILVPWFFTTKFLNPFQKSLDEIFKELFDFLTVQGGVMIFVGFLYGLRQRLYNYSFWPYFSLLLITHLLSFLFWIPGAFLAMST